MRRVRLLGVIAIAGCLVLVGARWFGSPQPELRALIHGSAGIGMSNVPYGAPRSVGGFLLCVTAPATAVITQIEVHAPTGDIRVQSFAVRPNPYTRGQTGLGAERQRLATYGSGFDPAEVQKVSGLCPTDQQLDDVAVTSKLSELGVEVGFSSGDAAGGNGLDVTYRIGGDDRTVSVPFGIWLCAAACPDYAGS